MLLIRRVTIATAATVLLCACGSKDSSDSTSSSGSSFSLGAKSPGNQLVDAFNDMEKGNLDPLVNLIQMPDTTAATREKVRNGFAAVAQKAQSHPVHVDLVSEKVTGDIASVVMKGNTSGGPDTGADQMTEHMIRSGDRWYWQTGQ